MAEQQIKAFNKQNEPSTSKKVDVRKKVTRRGQDLTSFQCIIFVGGLSGSQYVFDRLRQTFFGDGSLVGYPVEVVRPAKDS